MLVRATVHFRTISGERTWSRNASRREKDSEMTELQGLFAIAAENAIRIFCEKGQFAPMWHPILGSRSWYRPGRQVFRKLRPRHPCRFLATMLVPLDECAASSATTIEIIQFPCETPRGDFWICRQGYA
jgi:hypothetical protein